MTVAFVQGSSWSSRPQAAPGPRLLLALLLATSALLIAAPVAHATAGTEADLLSLVNGERTSRGLPPFKLQSTVSDRVSRPWTNGMASSGELSHSGSGQQILADVRAIVPSASSAGENVGYAGSVSALHQALMDSPAHRANILSSQFRYLGLGLAEGGGSVWLTQTFFAAPEPPAPAPASAPPPARAPHPAKAVPAAAPAVPAAPAPARTEAHTHSPATAPAAAPPPVAPVAPPVAAEAPAHPAAAAPPLVVEPASVTDLVPMKTAADSDTAPIDAPTTAIAVLALALCAALHAGITLPHLVPVAGRGSTRG